MRFFSDNAAPAHPKVMEAIAAANRLDTAYDGDEWSAAARRRFLGAVRNRGTRLLGDDRHRGQLPRARRAVPALSRDPVPPDAHIEVDEAGAPGFFTGGAKLTLLDGEGAKVTPDTVAAACDRIRNDVHQVQPAALSITNATEYGLVYRAAEVAALGEAGEGSAGSASTWTARGSPTRWRAPAKASPT